MEQTTERVIFAGIIFIILTFALIAQKHTEDACYDNMEQVLNFTYGVMERCNGELHSNDAIIRGDIFPAEGWGNLTGYYNTTWVIEPINYTKLQYYNGTYPNLIFRAGVNDTRMEMIVHSLNPEFYQGIEYIEFTNYDNPGVYAMYHVKHLIDDDSGNITKIYDGYIQIFNATYVENDFKIQCTLLHELGHHWEDLRGNTTEYAADIWADEHGCQIKYWRRNEKWI